MYKLLLIAAGGALGTLARYGTSSAMQELSRRWKFPAGTLLVNLLGCFLIGLLYGLLTERFKVPEVYRLAVITGFLGGYTTFSAYAWETVELFRERGTTAGLLYVVASNLGGIVMVILGSALVPKA